MNKNILILWIVGVIILILFSIYPYKKNSPQLEWQEATISDVILDNSDWAKMVTADEISDNLEWQEIVTNEVILDSILKSDTVEPWL